MKTKELFQVDNFRIYLYSSHFNKIKYDGISLNLFKLKKSDIIIF